MNQKQRFREGDRIVTKYPIAGLPAGSYGTVQLVFHSVNGVYDVLFEQFQTRRAVFQSNLNRIALARQNTEVSSSS
jgi:hypothetical protein